SILFASLHQWPFYPGTGGPGDQGETVVNVPLPAGTGDDDFLLAWEGVEEVVRRFEPQLLLVSCGFDAHVDDPLGGPRRPGRCLRRAPPPPDGPRAAASRRARRRLQPAHAAGPARGDTRGIHGMRTGFRTSPA